ncbi:MAG: peptidoglycan DD-metalloendopeptidase family protein [Bacteroidales bacterium]|nr:peptidoglycan DD-metalloendopeptidase family protein [Bacteroidales bacterium]
MTIFFIFWFSGYCYAQSRADLEEQRRKTLEEIAYVDEVLRNTEKEKNESLYSLKILSNKLSLRESVVKGMNDEIELLNERIELNILAIDMMESDLVILKNDYSNSILNSYRLRKSNPEIIYILSAKDFNQGYKRLKYLQQITEFRRNESEIIAELKQEIGETKTMLENDLRKISELKITEEQQKNLLKNEQTREQKILKSLRNKEKQLQTELEEKRRIAGRIEKEIARIIDEERKKASGGVLTPEQMLISDDFVENKGRLPWPVERGVITSHFGRHAHPILKYVTEENIGIEITSQPNTVARSIFKGEVSAVSSIQGANMTVIIKHGKYLSVYNNLVRVRVKKGDHVDIKQIVGDIYQNPGENNNCILKFMIFEERNALDPETWISKM